MEREQGAKPADARRCVMVAASDFNAESFTRAYDPEGDVLLAIDGGYAPIRKLGLEPAAALGDFDSLGYVPQGLPIERHPVMKDASDFELALDWAHREGLERVLVYGALGGRIDHTMAVLQCAGAFARDGGRILLVGMDQACAVMAADGERDACLRLPARDEGVVSVFSLTDESEGVTEEGLLYPLDDAVLTNTSSLGLSNEFVGKPARIRLQSGILLVFIPAELAAEL